MCATACIGGRDSGSVDSICTIAEASAPLRCGGSICPAATRCSRAMEFSSLPKGGVPSSAAYSVAPREKTSEAKSDASPRATSGARKAGVPCTMPLVVNVVSPSAREIPKSLISAVPSSAIKMFPGLTSRCTMPSA